MFDLWAAEHSVLREKVLERVFLAELSKVMLIELGMPFEVLRSEFDANGFDIVVEARGLIRHVQLKATRIGGKRGSVDVNLALAEKPSGCVIWFMADPSTLEIGPFYWLGGTPGERLTIPDGRSARHSRGNASGIKGERQGLRIVSMNKFAKVGSIAEVALRMFGTDHDSLLRAHLTSRGIDPTAIEVPRPATWDKFRDFAYMVDGYALCRSAGLGDPDLFADSKRAGAEASGRWEGSALELWAAIFLEHRRDKFGGFLPGTDFTACHPTVLDELSIALAAAVERTFPRPQTGDA